MKEIEQLSERYEVATDNVAKEVTITFPNNICVSFIIDVSNYPFGKFNYRTESSLWQNSVSQIVENIKPSYDRLSQICEAISSL